MTNHEPIITVQYLRTDADSVAEIAAERAAMNGHWESYMSGTTDGRLIGDIAFDAASYYSAKRANFADALAAKGWPNGMIECTVEKHFPLT